jgi:hypothetical protein
VPTCGTIGTDERALAALPVGSDEVDVRADLHGERQPVGKSLSTREVWSVRTRIAVRREGAEREIVWLTHALASPVTPRWSFADEDQARSLFGALAVTHCARGSDLVLRVGAPGGAPQPWVLLFLDVAGRVVGTSFASAAPSCELARLHAPALDAVLDRAGSEAQSGACGLLEALARRRDAIACVLRATGTVDTGVEQRLLAAVRAGGDAEADLYALLDPDGVSDEERGWSIARTETFLRAAPDVARRRAWVEATVERCGREAGPPCAAWRLRVVAIVASQVGEAVPPVPTTAH